LKISVISALGNPRNPKTWSNTPNNITQELERIGILGEVFESSHNNIIFKGITLFARVYYRLIWLKSKNSYLPFIFKYKRILNGWSSIEFLKKSPIKKVLHFGTLSMPLTNVPDDQNHYLFIDGTWDLWCKQATDMKGFTSKNIADLNKLEIRAYRNAKHIFSISEYVKDNLISQYNISSDLITVVGTGTGIIKPFFGQKDYTNGKILFAAKGRFNDKGGDLVLEAFSKALKVYPNLKLSIVGQNDYSSEIEHSNIDTFGFVSMDELQELFNSHSLFLMPAINEPWGLVYIEAMLCRMPIVGLNINSFPELSGYGKYGFGIDTFNGNLLAELIIDLVSNPSSLESIGDNCQSFALSKFTWEKTVSKICTEILHK
jgi:glycosyltransferase involved in cell wall biosynthesis